MSTFVEDVTTQKIVSKTNVYLLNGAVMSVVYTGRGAVEIVIGATWNNRESFYFSEANLQKLIDELTAIKGAMQ